MSTAVFDRGLVERLVRDALTQRNGNGNGHAAAVTPARKAPAPGAGPKVVVNVSARHAHVTQEDLERLYGKGHKLTPYKALYQDGFFAAEEIFMLCCRGH